MADLLPGEGRGVMTLRDAIDRLFEESFVTPWAYFGGDEHRMALDLYDEGDHITLEATVPGVKPEDVDIRVDGNLLTIKAESKDSKEISEDRYTYRERYRGVMQRTITLPADVDAQRASAKLQNGVLKLTLPKTERARTRRIEVKAN